jgi:hypothetical protein
MRAATSPELFRFAVLRAPELSDAPPETGIRPLSLTAERSALETELLASREADVTAVAQRFMASPAFISPARTADDLDALERLYAAALRRSRSESSLSRASLIEVANSAVRDLAGLSSRLGAIEDRIWSSFLATYVTGEGDGAVCERLTRLARAAALVEIATDQSRQQPAAALRGVPLLSVDVARRVRAVPTGVKRPGASALSAEIATARKTLREEMQALDAMVTGLRQLVQLRRGLTAWTPPNAKVPLPPGRLPGPEFDTDVPVSNQELTTLGKGVPALLMRHRLDASAPISSLIKSAGERIRVLADRSLTGAEPVRTTRAAKVSSEEASLTREAGTLAKLRFGDELLIDMGGYRPGIILTLPELIPYLPTVPRRGEAGWPSRIRPIGVLDLRLVRHLLTGYQLGEIAHIENVVAHEYRDRGHRRLKRTEETVFRESERTNESERSLETTERFELQQESQRTIEVEQQFEAGVNVTASYGPVSVAANAGYSITGSEQESEKVASIYAKEVTDKARQRVEQRVREGRTRVTVEELEETNTHRFENQQSDQHVVGIYRFVDKIYEAQIFNYGKRLMFEFLVPEPAAVHRAVAAQTGMRGLPAKVDPLEIGPIDLDPASTDYMQYVKAYGAQDVEPPPERAITVTSSVSVTSQQARSDAESQLTAQDKLTVPEGYVAKRVAWMLTWIEADSAKPTVATIAVGVTHSRLIRAASTSTSEITFNFPTSREKSGWGRMSDETGQLPISVGVANARSFALNVAVECEPSPARLQQWRLDTFQRIQEAAEQKESDYREAQARMSQLAARDGVAGASSPERNRTIERNELKRGCISLLSNLQFTAGTFDAVRDGTEDGIPVLDIENALREGKAVRFFENAFEWSQMTYTFYPYFWGSRARWGDMAGASDPDPLHEQFLQAGFARVLVPVARKQEINVLNYLEVGASAVFDGLEGAMFDDRTYGAIIRALENSPDDPAQAVPEGDPWEVVVPTSLVKLQLTGEEGERGLRGTG